MNLAPTLSAFSSLPWQDLPAAAPKLESLLRELSADKATLRALVRASRDDSALFPLCETYDILFKLVIFHDRVSDVRVRLHLFRDGYFDRPHNHRFTYGSLLLSGEYRHLIYGRDTEIASKNFLASEALQARVERTGNFYMLHHSVVHSVTASPKTISLVARGPSNKPTFVIADRVTGRVWTQTGAANETSEQRQQKMMSAGDYREVMNLLTDASVL